METSQEKIIDRYRARYKKQDRFFSAFDALLRFLIRPKAVVVPRCPQKILIANAGHLGDVIVSTALFPVLRVAYPEASFDFLTGTYSKSALQGHPFLQRVFFIDHWRSCRKAKPLWKKIFDYYRALPSLVCALRAEDYDMALDVHAWHPNYILAFWLAGIPVRVGYGRVGYGPTLTHCISFSYDRRPELDHQLDALRIIGIGPDLLRLAQPSWPPLSKEVEEKLAGHLQLKRPYRVLHPASSTPVRDWTMEGWTNLARSLLAQGVLPVLTGAGPRDAAMVQEICKSVPEIMNVVDRLTWDQLLVVIKGAELVYSVETSIGHIARALGRPVVSIYGGMADPLHWAPVGARVATHPMPCAPCYNKRGCATRECLTCLKAQDVIATATALLEEE